MRVRTAAFAASCLLVLGGAGCPSSRSAAPGPAEEPSRPAGAPSITGTITRLDPLEGATAARTGHDAGGDESEVGVALVEARPGVQGGARDAVRVTTATRILRAQGGRLVPASWGDLRTGQRVEAWHRGPVAESYPRQATAATLVITLEPGG